MVVDPAPAPVTDGCARGAVAPAGITTVKGDTAATDGSELASVTETVKAAGLPNATGKLTELPVVTVTFAGNKMPPAGGPVTTTVAPALAKPGALAVIVAEPAAKPVTGTGRLVTPVGKVAVAGTVATDGLLELKFTVNPDAAAVERLRVRFCAALPLIVRVAGDRLIV